MIARHRMAADGLGGDCPRQRARHRAGHRGDGRRQPAGAASPQGTHPTRTRGERRCRTTAPTHHSRDARTPTNPARHQPIPLSSTCPPTSGPPRKDHPMTPLHAPRRPPPPPTQPVTVGAASRYQQLRSHLAELKLHAAAEALPSRAGPGHRRGPVADRGVGAAAGRRSRRQHRPPPGRPVAVRVPAHPGHPGRLRRRRRRRDRPPADRRAGHLPLPGIGDQHFADRPAGHRQDAPVGRIGKGRSACRIPHLLHHRRRSGRPLPPRRDRGTLGHHHALLRRTDSAGDR